MADNICNEHTGCIARIESLEKTDCRQWTAINGQDDRIDNIMTRLNVILGGVAVAVVMLLLNLGLKFNGG